jgi:hypothetical protein
LPPHVTVKLRCVKAFSLLAAYFNSIESPSSTSSIIALYPSFATKVRNELEREEIRWTTYTEDR